MKIKIDHINLTASDLEESISWYGRVLGMCVLESGVSQAGVKWAIIGSNDSMVCMSEYPKREDAASSPPPEHHRINHFGVRVSDQSDWKRIVDKEKLRLYYGGMVEYPHSRSWYIHDPNGHEIEVSYSEDDHLSFAR
jgi:catechol-2,3-dioxygenase